jgi:hypothetical protein
VQTVNEMYQCVVNALPAIKDVNFANYGLSKFFLLCLVARALQSSVEGKEFWANPTRWVTQVNGWATLRESIARILSDLIVDLNHELDERAARGTPIDFKRELKSSSAAQKLASEIISSYEKLVNRGRTPPFKDEWAVAMQKVSGAVR